MRFILIDGILEMSPGQHIVAHKTLPEDEELFQDHFPGFPVVPGVLLTEMMAQAAGKCLDAEKKPRGKAMLARIESAAFRDWVRPGQRAVVYADIKNNQNKYATASCRVEVVDKTVCKAELFFAFMPLERFAPEYIDDVLEDFLSRSEGTA